MYSEITPTQVGSRLRSIRRSRLLSLNEVEVLSNGSLKAVVLGSYERGTRNLTIKRAIEIAKIYNIPVGELLTEKSPVAYSNIPRLIVDIRCLQKVGQDSAENLRRVQLSRLLRKIVEDRQDWNGEIITLRESDIGTIALLLDMDKLTAISWLKESKILLQKRAD